MPKKKIPTLAQKNFLTRNSFTVIDKLKKMHVFFIRLILILTNFKRLFPEVLLDKFLNSLSHYLMRHKAKKTKAGYQERFF